MKPETRIETIKEAKKICENPPSQYRSAPFWGWNSRMCSDQLRLQMRQMKRQGMGGFFIHAREGLETPYLSDEWMDLAEAAVAEAGKQNLEAWIYDEDKWPSGSAGGMVGAKDVAYIAKGLTFDLRKRDSGPLESDAGVIGRYDYRDGMEIILRMETSLPCEWYNGRSPTDTLNPRAVREFIRQTHETYRARIGREFGKSVRGFFTDEPNCFDFFTHFMDPRPWVPWTDGLAEYFAEKRKYDPTPYLPYLFADDFIPAGGKVGCAKLRHDFWRTVTERFSESYMKPAYDWCDDNGLRSAGHLLYENDLGYQVRVCGAVMPHYRYLHAPGVDILGEQIREYLTVKQCTSAARQYGRGTAFAEVYGCTGWNLTFAGQRWMANWLFAMGITRMCQHLALYSIKGCRKRDYPPVFNYQAAWWENDRYLENERGRIATALSTGEAVRDVLVIHPISSVWCACGSAPDEDLTRLDMNMGWTDEQFLSLNRYGEAYNRLAEMLLGLHIDFDFGDETILAETARVVNDRMRVGQVEYGCVIVPRVLSLLKSTYKLLKAFADHGGLIVWVKPFPELMEGGITRQVQKTMESILSGPAFYAADSDMALPVLLGTLRDRLSPLSVLNQTHREESEILSMLRKADDGYVLFLANKDRDNNHGVTVALQGSGCVEDFDAMAGTAREIGACTDDAGTIRFYAEVAAAGCKLFWIPSCGQTSAGEEEATVTYRHPHAAEHVFHAFETIDSYRRTMDNVLPLDCCRYALNHESYSGEMEVWEAQREIRERLGMRPNHYNGAPQRYTWIFGEPREKVPFSLAFPFTIRNTPRGTVYAAIEKINQLRVECGGARCGATGDWFMDRDLIKFRLDGLHQGRQELVISGEYGLETELENIFILGDFGVDADRNIVREPKRLRLGDWRWQGYYHYPGGMQCGFTVAPDIPEAGRTPIMLRAGEFYAALLKVWVNGVHAGILTNGAETLDVTKLLREKGNRIEIEAVGTPRNMMGPFHKQYSGGSRISWEDFRAEGDDYTAAYHTEPFGIAGPVVLLQGTL